MVASQHTVDLPDYTDIKILLRSCLISLLILRRLCEGNNLVAQKVCKIFISVLLLGWLIA